MSSNRKNLLTPCIGVCSTSTGDDVCRGCGRSLEQIREWPGYSDDEKMRVMDELKVQGFGV